MLRFSRMAACLMLVFAVTGQAARAQGGVTEAGAGEAGEEARRPRARTSRVGTISPWAPAIYNYDTALANQLNAQTFMQLNDYWAQVAHEAAFMHHARVHQEFLKDKTLYDAHIQALRDNPTPQQIDNGDALNQAVRDLSDPRLSSRRLARRQRAGRGQDDRRGPLRERLRARHDHARPVAGRLQVARGLRGGPLRQRQEALRRHRDPAAQGGSRRARSPRRRCARPGNWSTTSAPS